MQSSGLKSESISLCATEPPKYSSCCGHGKINLPKMQIPPKSEREATVWVRERGSGGSGRRERWLREERRWNAEREALLKEIQALQLQIQELKSRSPLQEVSVSETVANIVKLLQEALLKLGFYCGEEDMEYSSFSSGTERAVKTWQNFLRDYTWNKHFEKSDLRLNENPEQHDVNSPEARANGAPVASIMEISEFEQKVVKEGDTETDITSIGCFYLERTECDGSGEPNIEPQFLEWIDEDTKCPYCEGIGFVTCDRKPCLCNEMKLALPSLAVSNASDSPT
nr:protein disulfide isomerase pTAC5, chloroplastic [Ipomoea batatas]